MSSDDAARVAPSKTMRPGHSRPPLAPAARRRPGRAPRTSRRSPRDSDEAIQFWKGGGRGGRGGSGGRGGGSGGGSGAVSGNPSPAPGPGSSDRPRAYHPHPVSDRVFNTVRDGTWRAPGDGSATFEELFLPPQGVAKQQVKRVLATAMCTSLSWLVDTVIPPSVEGKNILVITGDMPLRFGSRRGDAVWVWSGEGIYGEEGLQAKARAKQAKEQEENEMRAAIAASLGVAVGTEVGAAVGATGGALGGGGGGGGGGDGKEEEGEGGRGRLVRVIFPRLLNTKPQLNPHPIYGKCHETNGEMGCMHPKVSERGRPYNCSSRCNGERYRCNRYSTL